MMPARIRYAIRMKLAHIRWLILPILTLGLRPAAGQQITQTQQQILQVVLAPQGYINEDLYNQFWFDFGPLLDEDEEAHLRKLLEANILLAQEYQRAAWKAIYEAALPGHHYDEGELKAAEEKYRAALQDLGILDDPAAAEGLEQVFTRTEVLLAAARSHDTVTLNGRSVELTYPMAKDMLDGLDITVSRIPLLLGEEWAETPPEYFYEGPNVTVRSYGRLLCKKSEEKENAWDLACANGATSRILYSVHRYDEPVEKGGRLEFERTLAYTYAEVDGTKYEDLYASRLPDGRRVVSWSGSRVAGKDDMVYARSAVWLSTDRRTSVMARVESTESSEEAESMFDGARERITTE